MRDAHRPDGADDLRRLTIEPTARQVASNFSQRVSECRSLRISACSYRMNSLDAT
ncbi:MAG: hypothetical protein JNJ54_17775 [Myxococcaceae bacterium]|nr:hypothetical protein [Myxococcaceae bacterium]